MPKNVDRKLCLDEVKINIERENIFSLRNAVRGLSDYSKIFLSNVSNHYPALNIVKDLSLKHRIKLLISLEPKMEKYEDVFIDIFKLRNAIDHSDSEYEKKSKLLKLLDSLNEIEKFYEIELLPSLENLSAKGKFLQDLKIANELVSQLGKYAKTPFYSGSMTYNEVCDKLNNFTQFAEGIDNKHDGLIHDKRVDLRDFQITLRNYITESQDSMDWEEAQIIMEQIQGK
jgi:hypothetical protein